jgi:hypothetical protein
MSQDSPPDLEPTPEPAPTGDASPAVDVKPAAYPFSVLRVVATSWRVTRRNLLPFVVLACVLDAPAFLLRLLGGTSGIAMVIALPLQMIANSLTTAVVSYGVIMELNGSRPSTRACITRGLSSLGRVLGVSLISGLVILAAMLLLIIPGIIVALTFFVIVPVTMIENLGIRAAMKRSRQLTAGRKGDLFLIAMIMGAFSVGIALVANQLDPWAAWLWRVTGTALSSTFSAVTGSVVYVVLRQLREGTQVPEIATAFARIRK